MLSFLIPDIASQHIMAATRTYLLSIRQKNVKWNRTEAYVNYYSAGNPWAPRNGGATCSGTPACESAFRTNGTTRIMCGPTNTYVALYASRVNAVIGTYKYAEFQTVCSSVQILNRSCFQSPNHYELFNLTDDPWEQNNIAYLVTSQSIVRELHKRVHLWYGCKGKSCP